MRFNSAFKWLNSREYVATALCVKFFVHQVCGLFILVTRCEYAVTSQSPVLLNVYAIALMALRGGSNKNTCVGWEEGTGGSSVILF
jgi:hypothetical protein